MGSPAGMWIGMTTLMPRSDEASRSTPSALTPITVVVRADPNPRSRACHTLESLHWFT